MRMTLNVKHYVTRYSCQSWCTKVCWAIGHVTASSVFSVYVSTKLFLLHGINVPIY